MRKLFCALGLLLLLAACAQQEEAVEGNLILTNYAGGAISHITVSHSGGTLSSEAAISDTQLCAFTLPEESDCAYTVSFETEEGEYRLSPGGPDRRLLAAGIRRNHVKEQFPPEGGATGRRSIFAGLRLMASKNSLPMPLSSSGCRKCSRIAASGTSCSKKLIPINFRMAYMASSTPSPPRPWR